MKTMLLTFGCAVLAAFTLSSLLAAGTNRIDKLAPDLRESMTLSADQRVIVTYAADLDESGVQALVSKSGRASRRLSVSKLITASVSRREIEALESDSRVLSISPDRKVVATMDVAIPTIGADRLGQFLGYTGKGVTVAVIDSGLTPNTAVPHARILASVDFTGVGRDTDAFGHGTHIAGTIGGSGVKGSVRGVAPGVALVSLRVLDAKGQGYVSSVIEAIDWTIAHRSALGIRVLRSFIAPTVKT